MLVEPALTNFFELNCSAMMVDGQVVVSRVDRPLATSQLLTFADKYLSGGKGFAPKSQVDDTFATQAQSLKCHFLQKLFLLQICLKKGVPTRALKKLESCLLQILIRHLSSLCKGQLTT